MTRGDIILWFSHGANSKEERADQMSNSTDISVCDGATNTTSELNQLTSHPTAHKKNTVQYCESINDLGRYQYVSQYLLRFRKSNAMLSSWCSSYQTA